MYTKTALLIALVAPTLAVGASNPSPQSVDPSQVVHPVTDMPHRGTSKEAVESQLGRPEQQIAPVGDPPISRWVYDRFTIYFEGNRVIHAVGDASDH